MRIADILAAKGRQVHTALPWTTIAQAVARLDEAGVGALLVCDADGRIRGIVSERDVVRGLPRHGRGLLDMAVQDVMTRNVATCTSEDTVATAMAKMTRGRFRHLPVVDAGRLVGLVSIGDLVKHRVREMELETGVLRDSFIAHH
ncbi:MAG: CBS domain-containing protein [Pseudonocardia sp.]